MVCMGYSLVMVKKEYYNGCKGYGIVGKVFLK
jgi:hypothetical protein